jgi:hypothetical protein
MLKLRVTIQVVNEDGDVMNTRGNPSILNKDGRLEAQRTLYSEFGTIKEAHEALNKAWAFVTPIDNMLVKS